MRINYQPTYRNLLEVSHIQSQSLLLRPSFHIVVSCLFLILGSALLFASKYYFVTGAILVSLSLVAFFSSLYSHFNHRSCLKNRKDLYKPVKLHISMDGIRFRQSDIDMTIEWSKYDRYADNAGFLLLYEDNRLINYIPKSAFNSPDDCSKATRIIRVMLRAWANTARLQYRLRRSPLGGSKESK